MNWAQVWQALGLTPPDGLAAQLRSAYSEPHRHYHALQHLRECLALLDQAQAWARQPAEIALALWFHDAVYDTHADDNEARSAAWASQALTQAGADPALIKRIEQLILATRHAHQPTDADAQLLVDIDLAILGSDPVRFAEYEQQIRQEYSWVEPEAFRTGRGAVLTGFLQRPRIYTSDFFVERYEQPARANLATALAALQA